MLDTATCERCGRVEDDPLALLGWSTSRRAGLERTLCETCAREHVRSIEARLDPSWW